MSAPPAPVDRATVEQVVRDRLVLALGGLRGVIEAAVPTAAFTVSWLASHQLRTSLLLSGALAVAFLLVRVAQRQNVQFVLNAIFGIGLAAAFALRSGRAQDAFLPGLLYNAGYTLVLVTSVVVRWPLVGFLVGSVTGDPVEWRRDAGVVRLCSRLTLVLAVPCIVRLLVQYPLYRAGHVGWLGTAKIALGWPLQIAAFAGMLALLARGSTPLPLPDATAPEVDLADES